MCSGQIDKGGSGQYYSDICFDELSSLAPFCILSGSSVVASWTCTLKGAGSKLIENVEILSLMLLPFCILPD